MFNNNTNLLKALSNGEKLTELFRIELEKTIHLLLKTELTEFLNYEKYDVAGYRSGNSRNGSYARVFKTEFGEITVDIPRNRNNEFSPIGIPAYIRTLGSLEDVVIHLYSKDKAVNMTNIRALRLEDVVIHLYSKGPRRCSSLYFRRIARIGPCTHRRVSKISPPALLGSY